MRLFEAIIDANHRALKGDAEAGLRLADYAAELPVVALTCVDPRLNPLFPGAMALPPESFIWLRNAGNIITGPLSSTLRSLALACAVKGGREIAIIGHTDCQVRRTSVADLIEKFKALGIERNQLPQNLAEFFGVFASERQNIIQAVDTVRNSPLIGPRVPVQGLLVDVTNGNLEWIVNGYEAMERRAGRPNPAPAGLMEEIGNPTDRIGTVLGEIKFPEIKIGEVASPAVTLTSPAKPPASPPTPPAQLPAPPPLSKPIPVPPPIRIHHPPRRG